MSLGYFYCCDTVLLDLPCFEFVFSSSLHPRYPAFKCLAKLLFCKFLGFLPLYMTNFSLNGVS